MCKVTIDGQEYQVDRKSTVLEACKSVNITIPTLCWLQGQSPLGACRVCLVEVEGMPALAASCTTPVREGMTVSTRNNRVRSARKAVVQLLLSEHFLIPYSEKT